MVVSSEAAGCPRVTNLLWREGRVRTDDLTWRFLRSTGRNALETNFSQSHTPPVSYKLMPIIVNGKKIAEEVLAGSRLKIKDLRAQGITPKLAVFLVGENLASLSYINKKQEMGQASEINVEVNKFPRDVLEEDLIKAITTENQNSKTHGIIIQLPLPPHLPRQKVLDAVSEELDVDCLTSKNKQKFIAGEKVKFVPPAPAAILTILEYYGVDVKNKHVLIVGSGNLVGKPLAALLLRQGISFELTNRHTENLKELALKADIIITAAGQAKLITADMVKKGSVVIDAGTAGGEEGEISGDVDFEKVKVKTSLITPVPGGVGPVTVAMLLTNVVQSAFASHLTC